MMFEEAAKRMSLIKSVPENVFNLLRSAYYCWCKDIDQWLSSHCVDADAAWENDEFHTFIESAKNNYRNVFLICKFLDVEQFNDLWDAYETEMSCMVS